MIGYSMLPHVPNGGGDGQHQRNQKQKVKPIHGASQNFTKSGKQGYELTIDPQHHAQAFLFSPAPCRRICCYSPARKARFPIRRLRSDCWRAY